MNIVVIFSLEYTHGVAFEKEYLVEIKKPKNRETEKHKPSKTIKDQQMTTNKSKNHEANLFQNQKLGLPLPSDILY